MQWGLPPEQVALLAARLAGDIDNGLVWAMHVTAVTAFLAAATQWRTAVVPTAQGMMLRWLGLDYAGARVAIDALGLAVTPRDWGGLLAIEIAARDALNGEAA